MGKRRKTTIRFYNSDMPQRREYTHDKPLKNNRYHVFKWLLDNVASQNNGKYLSEICSRGDYSWTERDRNISDQKYFKVSVKGNYIVVRQIRWCVGDSGINTFLGSLLGFEEEPHREEIIILRHPVRKWATFRQAYANAAPTLNVWLD